MTMIAPIVADAAPEPTPAAIPVNAPTPARLQRQDGWTPQAQRAFLELIAEGYPVENACRRVGVSHQSAYAFRRRAAGASFALGWQAASLLARNRIADALTTRALDGHVETITRPDGSTVTRHRFDNRLAMAVLTRLDRLADAQVAEGSHHAARLIAQEFDAFLDLIDRDEGAARAALFVGLRVGGCTDVAAGEMAPVVALARADRWCRTGAALADDVRIDDLDPAQRGHWTADQWARAEAAGLLTLAAPPHDLAPETGTETGPKTGPQSGKGDAADDGFDDGFDDDDGNPQLMQLYGRASSEDPVWWDEMEGRMMTSFPPPPDFDGQEEGSFGDPDYERALSDGEQAMLDAVEEMRVAPLRAAGAAARDAWFAWVPDLPGDPQAGPPQDATGGGDMAAGEAAGGAASTPSSLDGAPIAGLAMGDGEPGGQDGGIPGGG